MGTIAGNNLNQEGAAEVNLFFEFGEIVGLLRGLAALKLLRHKPYLLKYEWINLIFFSSFNYIHIKIALKLWYSG